MPEAKRSVAWQVFLGLFLFFVVAPIATCATCGLGIFAAGSGSNETVKPYPPLGTPRPPPVPVQNFEHEFDRFLSDAGEFTLLSSEKYEADEEQHTPRTFYGTYSWGSWPRPAPEDEKGFLDGFAVLAFYVEAGGELTCGKHDSALCREVAEDKRRGTHEFGYGSSKILRCGAPQKKVIMGLHRGCVDEPGDIGPNPSADLAVHWRADGYHYFFYLRKKVIVSDAEQTTIAAAGEIATWVDLLLSNRATTEQIEKNRKGVTVAREWARRRAVATER